MRSIVVCVKWTAPPGADVSDDRFAGVSAADQAALETALPGQTCRAEVVVATVGPDGADRAFRDGLACGASPSGPLGSMRGRTPNFAMSPSSSPRWRARPTWCCAGGDYSLDRGSGSVPAFIAHHRHAAQALGLVAIDIEGCTDDAVHTVRRLDGGRRGVAGAHTVRAVEWRARWPRCVERAFVARWRAAMRRSTYVSPHLHTTEHAGDRDAVPTARPCHATAGRRRPVGTPPCTHRRRRRARAWRDLHGYRRRRRRANRHRCPRDWGYLS